MKKYFLLAASSAALLAAPAIADDHVDESGWYLRGNVGWGMVLEGEMNDPFGPHNNAEIQGEGDLAGSLGIGYEFGEDSSLNNWRLELDGDSLYSNMGQIGNVEGSIAKIHLDTVMLNALYDFDTDSAFEPYLGVGAGLVQGKVTASAFNTTNSSGGLVVSDACLGAISASCWVDDKDTTWGAQLIAGLGIDIDENLTWDTHATYLWVDAGGLDVDATAERIGFPPAFTHASEVDNLSAASIMTGLRYKFGGSKEVTPPPPPPPVKRYKTCEDGSRILEEATCPTPPPPPPPPPSYTICDDGTRVLEGTACPVTVTYVDCPDGSRVTDAAYCSYVETVMPSYNNCGPSNVAIFNVPVNQTPKSISRLGTMPEFGDSHGLTPTQFFEKLQSRYNSNATDKAYLNYLFKSMGYSNGFADAQAYMFSDEVLPVGTTGMLGLGEAHHYEYSVLPSNDRDRQAFRIQSANGTVVHFMKTCGNYMYACN